jgi:DNA-binding response OmpR family regulator
MTYQFAPAIGVDQYFTKPVSTDVLLQEVQALLERGPTKKRILVVVLVRSLLAERHGLVQALRFNKETEMLSFLLFEQGPWRGRVRRR